MISQRAKSHGAFPAFAVWAVVVAALSAGCASPGLRGEIPFGRWSGHGEFVYEDRHSSNKKSEQSDNAEPSDEPKKSAGSQRQSIHRRYSTSLNIQPGRLEGHDVILLEIVSDRGPLPDLGELTHLKLALGRVKRISDSTLLYRGMAYRCSFRENEELGSRLSNTPFFASCITMEGTTTPQIAYLHNFVDTFRFRNGRVSKTGMLDNAEEGPLLQWSEELHRNK